MYKVELASVLPLVLTDFKGLYRNGATELEWKTASEEALSHFDVEFSTDGIRYETVGKVPATNSSTGNIYHFSHAVQQNGTLFYRLHMADINGQFSYSPIISVQTGHTARSLVYPTIVEDGILKLSLEEAFESLEIRNTAGQLVLQNDLQGKTGKISVPVSGLAQGMYFISLHHGNKHFNSKFIVR